jgi:polyisoprenoid-binding protein YceI
LAVLVFAASSCFAAAKPYKVDKNHSTVGFSITILRGLSEVTGKFTDFKIDLFYDDASVTSSSVTATIKTASINTGIPARDEDLRTARFFDAEKYPDITFKSKRIESRGHDVVAIGDFSMHGVTKEIALPITLKGAVDESVGFAATLPIKRSEYGINWKHNAIPDYIGDDVIVQIRLIASPLKETKPADPEKK